MKSWGKWRNEVYREFSKRSGWHTVGTPKVGAPILIIKERPEPEADGQTVNFYETVSLS